MTTPLERLIDQACGYPGMSAMADTIVLECGSCKRRHVAGRTRSDPKEAVRAVFPCPRCWPTGAPTAELKYFDKDDKLITPSWAAQG